MNVSCVSKLSTVGNVRKISHVLIVVASMFLFAFNVSAAKAETNAYTMEDLQILQKQGAYSELLAHLFDVPPSKRDEKWNAIAEEAAVKQLDQAAAGGDLYATLSNIEYLLSNAPALKNNKALMKQRGVIGIKAFAECFQDRYAGEECYKQLITFVKVDPTNFELAFEAGKLARLHMNNSSASQLFVMAFKDRPNAKECKDENVLLAATHGMQFPPENEVAQWSKQLAFELCYDQLKADLLDHFYAKSPASMCEPLEQKNELSTFQKAFCADEKAKG